MEPPRIPKQPYSSGLATSSNNPDPLNGQVPFRFSLYYIGCDLRELCGEVGFNLKFIAGMEGSAEGLRV